MAKHHTVVVGHWATVGEVVDDRADYRAASRNRPGRIGSVAPVRVGGICRAPLRMLRLLVANRGALSPFRLQRDRSGPLVATEMASQVVV